jgi:hypothetical protein
VMVENSLRKGLKCKKAMFSGCWIYFQTENPVHRTYPSVNQVYGRIHRFGRGPHGGELLEGGSG